MEGSLETTEALPPPRQEEEEDTAQSPRPAKRAARRRGRGPVKGVAMAPRRQAPVRQLLASAVEASRAALLWLRNGCRAKVMHFHHASAVTSGGAGHVAQTGRGRARRQPVLRHHIARARAARRAAAAGRALGTGRGEGRLGEPA
jgi:hypothetical protein